MNLQAKSIFLFVILMLGCISKSTASLSYGVSIKSDTVNLVVIFDDIEGEQHFEGIEYVASPDGLLFDLLYYFNSNYKSINKLKGKYVIWIMPNVKKIYVNYDSGGELEEIKNISFENLGKNEIKSLICAIFDKKNDMCLCKNKQNKDALLTIYKAKRQLSLNDNNWFRIGAMPGKPPEYKFRISSENMGDYTEIEINRSNINHIFNKIEY